MTPFPNIVGFHSFKYILHPKNSLFSGEEKEDDNEDEDLDENVIIYKFYLIFVI